MRNRLGTTLWNNPRFRGTQHGAELRPAMSAQNLHPKTNYSRTNAINEFSETSIVIKANR